MTETSNQQYARPDMSKISGQIILFWQWIIITTQQIMKDWHVYEFLDMVAVYLVQHPLTALFLMSVFVSCGIPILMFVMFAVLTVLLTFTGFIVIEGTILTVGSILLCGFLLGMLVVMLALAATVGVTYFGFMEVYGLLQKNPENSQLYQYLANHLLKRGVPVGQQKDRANAVIQQHDNHHED